MKTNISLSVIIPAYNAENTILSTLEKLQKQTFKNFEAVIVNDGSTDNTQKIVEKFLKNESLNWQLINQQNKGEGETRNTGLRNAKGERVLFLDADDYLSSAALEKLYNALNNHNAEISFSSYSYVYSNGSEKLYYHPYKVYLQTEIMKLFFRRLANPGIGNTLIKKSLIDKHNLKFEKYKAGADNHFFRKLLLHVDKVVSIEENLFFYIYNDSSVMNSSYSFNRLDSIYSVLDTIKEYKEKNINENIIKYLDVFLISEIRGNAMDFYIVNGDTTILKEKILTFLPKKIELKHYLSSKRTVWLFSLYIFYKFPLLSLKFYKFLKDMKK